ncbi:MAG TPA: hypothetical protein VFF30_16810 [Nitrososphaerales archaeon]|nr:hypothetical protein [Nitrososphaerales archaeon]
MKAVLFKYQADVRDPELKDNKDVVCGLRDPDFWINPFPVWGVCGPYVRSGLEVGDVLFFPPQLSSIRRANLGHTEYVCTGILVVSEILANDSSVMSDERLNKTYRKYYRADLTRHNKPDKGKKTSPIRRRKFVIGTPELNEPWNGSSFNTSSKWPSKWFGRKGPRVRDIVEPLGITSTDLKKMRIPYLWGTDNVRRLYVQIMSRGS